MNWVSHFLTRHAPHITGGRGAWGVGRICYALVAALTFSTHAAEPWPAALAAMPLRTNVTELNRTNVAAVLLNAFRPDATVKALVLQPGATDEFYFFRRAQVALTNAAPTLLDAVRAITNQTNIRATFRAPLLLLHTEDDPTEPLLTVEDAGEARRLRERRFLTHFLFNDHDWNHVQPILQRTLRSGFTGWPVFAPPPRTSDSWHFFRHAVAGWNLDGWETLEAISLANKTVVTIRRHKVIFEGDERIPNEPPAGKSLTTPVAK